MSDEEFLSEFEACRWPLERWHHEDHIRLVYLYLRRDGFEAAVKKIREAIRAHNVARAIAEGPNERVSRNDDAGVDAVGACDSVRIWASRNREGVL